MQGLGNKERATLRRPPAGLGARILTLALLAAGAPFAALVCMALGAPAPAFVYLGFAALGAGAALAALARAMQPLRDIAVRLQAQAGADAAPGPAGSARAMSANLAAILRNREGARARAPTGLPHRESFLAAVARELEARRAPALLGIARMANFDQLAAFDPAAAERVLARVAERLNAAVRSGRTVAQVDRDCFALWFGACDPAAATTELEALGYVLAQEVAEGDATVTPDIQLGSALYPVDAEEPANLLNRAFVSLARPQRTADGGLAFFARPAPHEARQRFSLEQRLRQALRRGEFELLYQPVADLDCGRAVSAEALLRWRDEAGEGASLPNVVEILEETGLIHEVGLWTLNTACRQLRDWRKAGLTEIKVAVNLSTHQLRDPALARALAKTVESHGLSPAQIELELTETAAMEDAARTLALFQELREAGFGLAIDDFGSGYSSFAYLRTLPFHKLKIDRSFVTRVDARADSRAICKAVIDLTAGLDLTVLAEGVERREEVEMLHAMGCSLFQGFYFARPLRGDELPAEVGDPAWLSRLSSPMPRRRAELGRRLS